MNKSVISMGVLLATISIFPLHAAPGGAGQIEFTGTITASTCDVDINGQGGNPTINMGTISSSVFKQAGDFAGAHRIRIELTNCETDVLKKAAARFSGSIDSINNNLLALKSGGASGLGIEFLNRDGSTLPLGTNPNEFVDIVGTAGSSDAHATLLYSARYKSTVTAVTTGAANAVADYTIIYN